MAPHWPDLSYKPAGIDMLDAVSIRKILSYCIPYVRMILEELRVLRETQGQQPNDPGTVLQSLPLAAEDMDRRHPSKTKLTYH